jgi:septal ring factor EnvC (AmiA/AmiB activator)
MGVALWTLQRSLRSSEELLRPYLKVALILQSSLSDADAEKWANTVASQDSELESATFVSRQEALQRAQNNPALAKSLLLLRDNPFPASVILHYKETAWLNRPEPAMVFKGLPQVQEIRWDPEERSYFRSIHEWRMRLFRLSIFAGAAGLLSLVVTMFRAAVVLLVIARLPTLCYADAYDTLLKRYEKQIGQQERELTGLRGRLAEKERDVTRWRTKADQAKTEWTAAGAMLDQTRAKIKSVHVQRQSTRLEADAAQWKTTESILLSHSAGTEARALALDVFEKSLVQNDMSEQTFDDAGQALVLARLAELSATSQIEALAAQKEETDLRVVEMRYQNVEESSTLEADRIHQRQEAGWLRWQEAEHKKTALEDEISQMDQSAKALQVMLQELKDHHDQAIALRENRSVNDHVLASLKGTLPWPAQGKIIQNFGRQYSDGLNQLVVSNGIKIASGAGHTVRVIQEGKVLFANAFRQYGQLVIVQHKHGLTSVYAGLGQTQVKEGQTLMTLDQIGLAGDSGSFYFELRRDEQPINPLVYLTPISTSELSSRRKFR